MSNGLSAKRRGSSEELVRNYLKDRRIVVADPSPSSNSTVVKALIEMGAKVELIDISKTFDEAENQISKLKPHIVISEYDLGKKCGLDLLQRQRAEQPDIRSTLFMLVTGNTSQSAVARAAEEDIDAYIVRPFTSGVLRNTLLKSAAIKLQPDEYRRTIEAGRQLLQSGKVKEANASFQEALKLDPSPSLAHFYLGQVHLLNQETSKAEREYLKGLELNKIHYKCMIGLYEIYMNGKRFPEAYELVKKVSQYYPANPQRLTSVLKLAIMTHSYEDVERYYQVFTKLDSQDEEAVRYICAALVVCGKYYLQTKVPSRAIELFKKAAVTGPSRIRIIYEIVVALFEERMIKEAKEFLKMFPREKRAGPEFRALSFALDDFSREDPRASAAEARKLIEAGMADIVVYQVLIRRLSQIPNEAGAKQALADAVALWPDEAESLERIARLANR